MSNGEVTLLQAPVWVDGVTPLNSVNMTQLQTRDEKNAPSGYVGLDASRNVSIGGYYARVGTGGSVAFATAESGDTVNRWQVYNTGSLNWSSGSAAADTNLYRYAADVLKTDDSFMVAGGTIYHRSDVARINFGLQDDVSLYRYDVNKLASPGHLVLGGEITTRSGAAQQVLMGYMGSGQAGLVFGSAADTNLYRSAAYNLKTDYSFTAGQAIIVDASDTANKLYFGSSLDTYLYRAAAGTLKTDGSLFVNNDMVVDRAGGGYRLYFGSAFDTSLYRAAATVLKTDGSFRVVNYLDVDSGGTGVSLRFGSAFDTNLYRSFAAVLRTDGGFRAAQSIVANHTAANQIDLNADGHIYFGSAADTNLYRSAASQLKTDGGFYAVSSSGLCWSGSGWTLEVTPGVVKVNGVPIGGGTRGQNTVTFSGAPTSAQVTFAHGLGVTPTNIQLTSKSGIAYCLLYVVSADATNITVEGRDSADTARTGTNVFYWVASP